MTGGRAQSGDNLALLAACDGAFKHHLDRTKYPERSGGGAGAKAFHHAQAVEVLLGPLDRQLQRADQLGGATPCAADIAIFPFVRQFAAVEPAWFGALPLPALQGWLGGCQTGCSPGPWASSRRTGWWRFRPDRVHAGRPGITSSDAWPSQASPPRPCPPRTA